MPVPGAVSIPYRINSGGGGYTDDSGNVWSADSYYVNQGGIYNTTESIDGTLNEALYKSERWCSPGYRIPVQNGQYTVV